MGLDASFWRENKNQSDELDYRGEEIAYFRKFYALDNFMHSNCSRICDGLEDAYKISVPDLKNILVQAENPTDDYWEEEYFQEQRVKLIDFLKSEIENPTSDFYYYTFIN